MMQDSDLYSKAHLVVAAIRILEYRKKDAPSVEALCDMLDIPTEQGNILCNKLHDTEIIEVVKWPYGARLFVRNHLKIEEIPRDKESSLQDEVTKFQTSRKDFKQKIESFQAERAERQKNLFAEVQKKLGRNVEPTS